MKTRWETWGPKEGSLCVWCVCVGGGQPPGSQTTSLEEKGTGGEMKSGPRGLIPKGDSGGDPLNDQTNAGGGGKSVSPAPRFWGKGGIHPVLGSCILNQKGGVTEKKVFMGPQGHLGCGLVVCTGYGGAGHWSEKRKAQNM